MNQSLKEVFSKDSSEKLLSIKSMLQSNDFEGVKNALHTIKGGASFIKADEIRSLVIQAEECCAERDADGVLELVERIGVLVGKL